MGKVLIGVSTWADRSLVASGFYPANVKTPTERLKFYAGIFSIAEIDASYHYLPTRRNLEVWLGNTPSGFVFDIKTFSLFTQHPTPLTALPHGIREAYANRIETKGNIYPHHLPGEAIEALWQGFIRSAETIKAAGKLGAIVFQFPPWFHSGSENFDYIKSCRERLGNFSMAVEFRTGDWLNDGHREETLSFLHEKGISLVCVDEPQGFKTSLPPVSEVTAPIGFVRFHGRNSVNWERKGITAEEKYAYLYNENELREWVPRIQAMAREADVLHVVFKNKHADFPVKNAIQFRRMLDESGV